MPRRIAGAVTCADRMRAAGITALGEPVEILEVDELATPAAGEVLIDVVAAGIGNSDELGRIGSWQTAAPTWTGKLPRGSPRQGRISSPADPDIRPVVIPAVK